MPGPLLSVVRGPFSRGQLCEEYVNAQNQQAATQEEQEANEQQSRAFIQQNSKQCPSPRRGVNIDKISGCDHITCQFAPAYPVELWRKILLTISSIKAACAATSSAGCALHLTSGRPASTVVVIAFISHTVGTMRNLLDTDHDGEGILEDFTIGLDHSPVRVS